MEEIMNTANVYRSIDGKTPQQIKALVAKHSENPRAVKDCIEFASEADMIYCNQTETYVPIAEFARDIFAQNYSGYVTVTSVVEYCIPDSTAIGCRQVRYPSLDDYDATPED